jgi:hypothetical protein
MKLLVKPEVLTSYIYGPTFGNAESRLFLFAAQCFNTESMRTLFCGTVVCKHFASFQGYLNYRWDLTLSLLMSCVCVYIYTWIYVWQRWKLSLSIFCTMFQDWINVERYTVSQLCVNTLPATKGTRITDGIYFGTLRYANRLKNWMVRKLDRNHTLN